MLGDSWNACNKKVILKVFMLKPSINLTHLIMTHHMTSANESRNDSSWVIIMPDQSNKWNVFLTYCKNIFRWSNQNLALVYLTTDWLTKSRTWLALSQLEDAFIRNTSALKFIFFLFRFFGRQWTYLKSNGTVSDWSPDFWFSPDNHFLIIWLDFLFFFNLKKKFVQLLLF